MSPTITTPVYQAAIEHASIGIIMADRDGGIIKANPFALGIFGYALADMKGMNLRELFPARMQKLLNRRLSGNKGKLDSALPLLLQALDSRKKEIPVSLQMHLSDEHLIAYITRETTNGERHDGRNGVKQLLHKTGKKAGKDSKERKSEEEFWLMKRLLLQLLHNFPDGAISIVDRELRFLLTGGELHQQLGINPSELVGKEIYPRFPKPLRELMRRKITTLFQDLQVVTDFELPFHLNGHSYVMDAFPLMEEDGNVRNCGIMIRNISKLKQTEDTLKTALKKEKDLNEMKSKFVSMASHEFRTPLSTVLSSAFLIDKYTTTEEQVKRQKHVGRIVSAVNTLTDILNDFLSLGRIEEGRIIPRPTHLDIRKFISSLLDEMENNLKPGQSITFRHTGNAEVYVDGSMLMHILMNLLSNASKFSPEGGIIKIRTISRRGCLTISVKDQGIGISSEDQQHLMERFFRGGNTGNIQGTGLGLHIISKYLELMNGRIHFRSELGHGTEFIIELKITDASNEINPGS